MVNSCVAMATVDTDSAAVTTALMVACEEEDVDQVRQLLSVDNKVRIHQYSVHLAYTHLYTCIQAASLTERNNRLAYILPKLLLWQDTFGVFSYTSGAVSDVIFLLGDR